MEISNKDKEELKKSMMDDLIFGESYLKVDSDGIQRLDPLDLPISLIDKLRPYQEIVNLQSLMFTEKLTLDEIIERYPLTEEQIINLKKLMNNGK